MNMLDIRAITDADLADIVAIQAGSPGSAASWQPADYLTFVTWIAILDGSPAGFLAMRTLAADDHELLNLAVSPQYRRRGVASALYRFAKEHSPGIWFLEVRESNTGARTFYKSHGFNELGRRKGYYRDPYEDAIVMRI